MVIIDTNIIIEFLRSSSDRITIFEKLYDKYGLDNLAISIVSVQELYAGSSTLNLVKTLDLVKLIARLNILDYNFEIAKEAGKVIRDSIFNIDVFDAVIAATSLTYHYEIATFNTKHFRPVRGIKLLDLTTLS